MTDLERQLQEALSEAERLRAEVRLLRDAIATAQSFLQDEVMPGLETAWYRTKP